MSANIKIGADTASFQQQMKAVTQDIKVMSGELSNATLKATLFGNEQEQLEAKTNEFNGTLKGQTKLMDLYKNSISNITNDIQKYKSRNTELATSIADVESKLQEEIRANGEGTEEAKKLTKELNNLQKEYNANEKAIGKSESAIQNYKVKMNGAEKAMLQAEKALKDLDSEVEESPKKLDKLADSADKSEKGIGLLGKGFGILSGAIVGAIGGAIVSGIKGSEDLTKAMNGLQARTGATSEEMQGFRKTVEDINSDAFGEGFQDIADSVELVSKNLGESGDSLTSATESAITLRDTFDYDVSESTRAAKALMIEFGLSSEQAFNLITQGSQQGLNFSGEFLDNISEYSAQFSKMGMSAEDYFNILLSGTQAGGYSLDKVNDQFKEFSLRLTDGSKTTADALSKLGLNANDVATEISKGGDSASGTYYKVIEALNNMDDKQEQNSVGVALMGTLFEDNGIKVTQALANMNDSFNRNIDSMQKMKEIKYNDLGSAFSGIGKQLTSGLIDPITTKVLPILNEFANWVQQNMPQIQATISKAIDIAIPLFEGLGNTIKFTLDNANWLVPVLLTLTGAIAGLKVIGGAVTTFAELKNILTPLIGLIGGAGGAGGLAGVLTAITGPIGIAIGAIALLVGAFVFAYNNSQTFRDNVNFIFNQIKDIISGVIDNIKTIITVFVQLAQQIWKEHGNEIMNIINLAFSFIASIITTTLNIISNVIKVVTGIIKGDWGQVWEGIKGLLSSAWNGITSILSNGVNLLQSILSSGFGVLLTIAGSIFGNIKTAITSPISSAVTFISEQVQKIKGFFSNLSIKLPDIKLPHFSVKNWSINPADWVTKGNPYIDVEWYADGGIMTNPTLFGFNGDNAMVGGEAGAEAILPLSELWSELGKNFDKLATRLGAGKERQIESNGVVGRKEVTQNIHINNLTLQNKGDEARTFEQLQFMAGM